MINGQEVQLNELIEKSKKSDRRAQNLLFERFAPRLLSVCFRYMKSIEAAEDMLVQGFYKIFDKMDSYSGKGSFEGWMKRIMINECLMELRRNKNFALTIPVDQMSESLSVEFEDRLSYEEVIALLDQLPVGYRTVFNLYVIEGYKHREIAEKLGISINTSKSQLILARRKLQKLIKKNFKSKIA